VKLRLAHHWPAGVLGLCAAVTLALLLWPIEAAGPKRPPTADRYSGADHPARNGATVAGFALRLQAAADAEAAPVVESVPALVGIAGGRAYLRSTVSGEVEGLAVGLSIDGWNVTAVGRRAVTLRGASGERRLELFARPATAPEPETAPAPDPSPTPSPAAPSPAQGGG